MVELSEYVNVINDVKSTLYTVTIIHNKGVFLPKVVSRKYLHFNTFRNPETRWNMAEDSSSKEVYFKQFMQCS